MTDAQTLLDEWTEGEQNGMRPARVQAVRDDLSRVTGQSIPRRITDIENFLSNQQLRGVITRKLKRAADGTDDNEDT